MNFHIITLVVMTIIYTLFLLGISYYHYRRLYNKDKSIIWLKDGKIAMTTSDVEIIHLKGDK